MLAALNLCKQATALLLAQPPMLPAGGRSRPAARGETTHPITAPVFSPLHPYTLAPQTHGTPPIAFLSLAGSLGFVKKQAQAPALYAKVAASRRFLLTPLCRKSRPLLHSSSSNHRRSCLQIPQPIHRETNPRRPTSRPTIPRPSHPHTCCLIRAPPDNPLGHPRVADPRLIRARDGAQAHASPP